MRTGTKWYVSYWLKDGSEFENFKRDAEFDNESIALDFEEELIIDNAIGLDGDKSRVGKYSGISVEEINWDKINRTKDEEASEEDPTVGEYGGAFAPGESSVLWRNEESI